MKRTITIMDKTGSKEKIITREYNVRNESLLQARLMNKAQTFKPQKGRGSFKRNPKHKGQFA